MVGVLVIGVSLLLIVFLVKRVQSSGNRPRDHRVTGPAGGRNDTLPRKVESGMQNEVHHDSRVYQERSP
jgi:hypothetical protein